ncbi:uncharacterized protein LOC122262082 [Penaeus japonicus]|uniref:uncharacterized protein LOC122262082 n=1 Tax=Penaeus japonicus TaxID=27405 RepID=UPI001C70B337|nr:uncharacterized protein LOC122262082 [Penaeus japonicus]
MFIITGKPKIGNGVASYVTTISSLQGMVAPKVPLTPPSARPLSARAAEGRGQCAPRAEQKKSHKRKGSGRSLRRKQRCSKSPFRIVFLRIFQSPLRVNDAEDSMEWQSRRLVPPRTRLETRVRVSGVPVHARQEELERILRSVGEVEKCEKYASRDGHTQVSHPFVPQFIENGAWRHLLCWWSRVWGEARRARRRK